MAELMKHWHCSEYAETEYKKLQAENAHLKAQLTWRPVTQKPEKGQYFLVNPTRISNKPRTFCFLGECSWESFVVARDIKEWLPIPPAPEGE